MRYGVEYGVELFDQFMISEAFDTEAVPLKKSGAPFISEHIFLQAMLVAIQFDYQLCLEADEIDDVGTYRLLAPEFCLRKSAVAERLPKLALDVGLIATQLAGEDVFHCVSFSSPLVGEDAKSYA
jgi:hypothetical protein